MGQQVEQQQQQVQQKQEGGGDVVDWPSPRGAQQPAAVLLAPPANQPRAVRNFD